MAWEWVGPAATAAVGLAGIGATYFTSLGGRRSAEHIARTTRVENRWQTLRRERREAYAAYLAILEEVDHTASRLYLRPNELPPMPDPVLELRKAFDIAHGVVLLVGSRAVKDAAVEVSTDFKEAAEFMSQRHGELRLLDRELNHKLTLAMRQDLGIDQRPVDPVRTEHAPTNTPSHVGSG